MKNRPLCVICLALVVFLCVIVYLGGDLFLKELSPSRTERTCTRGDVVSLTGRIYQKVQKNSYQLLYLKENSIEYHQQSLKESRIIVYEQTGQNVKIGDLLEITGEIEFFEPARNPGNFDQKKYYQRQNIHASVWAKSITVKMENGRTWTESLKEELYQFQQLWRRHLTAALGETEAGIFSAMLLGDKTQLDGDVKELYQVSGIGHILAISGVQTLFLVYMWL